MTTDKKQLGPERRKYIRLDSVFPVEFRLSNFNTRQYVSDWLQGFTSNLSKSGICLVVNNLKPEPAVLIKGGSVRLSLKISLPIAQKPISASVRVAWVKEIAGEPSGYLIGLAYEEIDPRQNNKIMRYARAKKLFFPLALTIIIILSLSFTLSRYMNMRLTQSNRTLVARLVKVVQETNAAKRKIKEISSQRQSLQAKSRQLENRIQKTDEEKKQKSSLEEQLAALKRKEDAAGEELALLDKSKVILEKANLAKMYQWLKVHQNPRTGLVMSFEGDSDIANWAFTYDQALMIQAYTYFGDYERAKKILDFFNGKAERVRKNFVNAYYAGDGGVAEYTVHSGPNIWLGIAALQYIKTTGDSAYLGLAEGIASSMIELQDEDKGGGIRGGPEAIWYSSEHNLDAYAFFNMLYKITAQARYARARDRILKWLIEHTYDLVDIPVKRGKGDATIATDTYAWSIAAIGPEKLQVSGMNPDQILDFAEKNCVIEVDYIRPEGQVVKIKGFDFAPLRHLPRGGVVSSEWTAQMIMSFRIMADFYRKKSDFKKADNYDLKAEEYLAQLARMIISSPSPSGQGESCLPYATQDFADTGHGWVTPKGKSTGSVSGTAYAIFAYYKYNPLELRE
jgi:hypothetical protein